jgi:hypothetical protein
MLNHENIVWHNHYVIKVGTYHPLKSKDPEYCILKKSIQQ